MTKLDYIKEFTNMYGCSLSFFSGDNFTSAYNKISCCYQTSYDAETDSCEYHRQESYFFENKSVEEIVSSNPTIFSGGSVNLLKTECGHNQN